MVQIIAFSFNRAMQLDALLTSLIEKWKAPKYKIDVVYNYTTDEFGKGYEFLEQKFKKKAVTLHKESTLKSDKVTFSEIFVIDNWVRLYRYPKLRNPISDFRSILINIIEQTIAENVMFLTDDSMFISDVDIPIEDLNWINEKPEHRQFSLRLGKGESILPATIDVNDTYCQWNMYAHSKSWGYPFSVDAHLYNKHFILKLFKKLLFYNPSTLEGYIVGTVRRHKLLAEGRCFTDIKMLTFPINIVQTCVDNLSQNVSVEMLNKRYLEGETLKYIVKSNLEPPKQYTDKLLFTDRNGKEIIINISTEQNRLNV